MRYSSSGQRIRWAGLIILRGRQAAGIDDNGGRESADVRTAGRNATQRGTDQFFTAGLFRLDALLTAPWLSPGTTSLSAEVNCARTIWPVSEVLRCVLTYEQGNWKRARRGLIATQFKGLMLALGMDAHNQQLSIPNTVR
jgi:hypothetical protein